MAELLSEFKAKGLPSTVGPITHQQLKDKNARNEHRRQAVPMLASRMKDYRPAAVVALMLEIESMVGDAMDQRLSSLPALRDPLPHLSQNVKAFKEEMAEIIPKLPVNGSYP